MSENKFVIIVNNLYDYFFQDRKLTPKTTKPTKDQILVNYDQHGYIKFEMEEPITIILIMNPMLITKTANLPKILNQCRKEDDLISFIPNLKITDSLASKMTKIKKDFPKWSFHLHDVLLIPVLHNPLVAKHEIMNDEQKNTFLSLNYINPPDLPLILTTDPCVIWLGAKEGDIIKVVDNSETAVKSYSYRRVVHARL